MKIFLGAFLILLTACASSPPGAQDTPSMGQVRKTTVDKSKEYFAAADGWQIWKLSAGETTLCAAIKPAAGTSWPEFSKAYQTFYGGGGFYMSIPDSSNEPYFGFYGEHPYRYLSTAEVNGTTITDINHRDTVLSWEGLNVSFSLPTQPSRNASQNIQQTSGTVDFTGVTKALEQMMECHGRYQATW